jgi:hypothetical protein
MRPFAAIALFFLMAGVAPPAAANEHPCWRSAGSSDATACGLGAWRVAARDAERPGDLGSNDEKACTGTGSGGLADWISACDRLIASGKLDKARLIAAYRNRGNWHQLKRDHAPAVADYDEVFRRDPRNALADNSRKASLRAICFGRGEPEARIEACTRFIDDLAANESDPPSVYPVPAGARPSPRT